MTYLLHGSTSHTAMGWLDLVPRAGGPLYIGGLYALYQTDLISVAGITHVVSVIDYDALLQEKFSYLKHFQIRVEDHPNADLLVWFAKVVRWIDGALRGEVEVDRQGNGDSDGECEKEKKKKKGAVFIHCAMGKSRSATIVVAYLMWRFSLDLETALKQLCEGRPVCDPNPGFKEQLEVWGRMCKVDDEGERRRIYEEWERSRFVGEPWEWDRRVDWKAKL